MRDPDSEEPNSLDEGPAQSEREVEAGLTTGPFSSHQEFINALNSPGRGRAYEDLADELRSLWLVLQQTGDSRPEAQWFDDFLSHNELGLALHVLCDALLRPETQVAPEVVFRVEGLHRLMGITDECVELLRRKLR